MKKLPEYCALCGCYLACGMIERSVIEPTWCVECADDDPDDGTFLVVDPAVTSVVGEIVL